MTYAFPLLMGFYAVNTNIITPRLAAMVGVTNPIAVTALGGASSALPYQMYGRNMV